MKDIFKKWWFYAGIIILLIIIISVIIIINNRHSIYYDYKEQSISILEDYKSGNIDNEKAADKIATIRKRLDKEIKNDNKSSKKTKDTATSFSSYLKVYAISLIASDKTSSEINEQINFIKKDINL